MEMRCTGGKTGESQPVSRNPTSFGGIVPACDRQRRPFTRLFLSHVPVRSLTGIFEQVLLLTSAPKIFKLDQLASLCINSTYVSIVEIYMHTYVQYIRAHRNRCIMYISMCPNRTVSARVSVCTCEENASGCTGALGCSSAWCVHENGAHARTVSSQKKKERCDVRYYWDLKGMWAW